MAERRGETTTRRPAGTLVWVHGASVGELTAAIPLIERLRALDHNVLVTTGTVTSAALAEKRLPPGVIHQFVPLDLPPFVARFFDHWRPDLALFVESDLWPNMIMASARRGIPIIVVNGRMSERSFERWRYMPDTIEALLTRLDLCLVRTTVDAERFAALGAPRITTTGNLKLDVPPLPVDEAKLAKLAAAIAGRPVIAAASTHLGEEEAVIDTQRRLKASFRGLLTILAPRHPERGQSIASAIAAAGLTSALRSRDQLPHAGTDIYIADTVGELGLIYRLAPIVFMGGSLIRTAARTRSSRRSSAPRSCTGRMCRTSPTSMRRSTAPRAPSSCPTRAGCRCASAPGSRTARSARAWRRPPRRRSIVLGGALERTLTALEPYLMQLRLEHHDA